MDADCSGGGTCNPFRVCRSNAGPQPQVQMCVTDAECTAPATCQRPLGGAVVSSVTVDPVKGALYVSTGDCVGSGAAGFANSLISLDAQTGALLWSFHALPQGDLEDFDFIASPNLFTATDGMTTRHLVGAGNKNGVYYALDADTGTLVWQRLVNAGLPNLFGGFNASAGVAFGNIFAGTFTGPPYIFALRAFDGTTAWTCPGGVCTTFSFGPPGIADHVALLGDSSGSLRAFDVDSGAVLRSIDLGGGISSGPAVANGMVVVGAGTGVFGTSMKQGVYGLALSPTP
jgi:polyvinyl alcohol dehydrogenase (cytochrome)